MLIDARKVPVSEKLLDLIKSRIPEDEEFEICIDVNDELKKRDMTFSQLCVLCANTGLEFYGKSGRWVMPWMSVKR